MPWQHAAQMIGLQSWALFYLLWTTTVLGVFACWTLDEGSDPWQLAAAPLGYWVRDTAL